jgi:hypothetical protein
VKSKWNIYIGSLTIILSIIAIAVAVTTPEVRRFIGLRTNPPSEELEMKKVDLIVQNESQQPLSTVNVEFISDGAPEPVLTDANGYAQIKIPSTTDVQITLRKDGFETKSYRIDLKKEQGLTRKYTLKSTSPLTPPTPPDELSPVPPSPSPKPSTTPVSPASAKPPKVDCKIVDEIVDSIFSDGKYTETIPVANKPEQPVSRLYVTRDNPRSVLCTIQKNFGELPLAYALPENSRLDSIVAKVYIDGNLRKNVDLNRGEALREKIDIKGASTYKLEFSVPDKSDKGDYIYVLER